MNDNDRNDSCEVVCSHIAPIANCSKAQSFYVVLAMKSSKTYTFYVVPVVKPSKTQSFCIVPLVKCSKTQR